MLLKSNRARPFRNCENLAGNVSNADMLISQFPAKVITQSMRAFFEVWLLASDHGPSLSFSKACFNLIEFYAQNSLTPSHF